MLHSIKRKDLTLKFNCNPETRLMTVISFCFDADLTLINGMLYSLVHNAPLEMDTAYYTEEDRADETLSFDIDSEVGVVTVRVSQNSILIGYNEYKAHVFVSYDTREESSAPVQQLIILKSTGQNNRYPDATVIYVTSGYEIQEANV